MECEIPVFYSVKEPKARAPRVCCECRAPINKGEVYVYCVGKWDEIETFSQHQLCATACRLIRKNELECIPFGYLKTWVGDMGGIPKDTDFHREMRFFFSQIKRRERREKVKNE